MSKEKHLKAREEIGLFFAARRKEMGHTCNALAEFIGITENTMSRIEEGKFDYDVMLLFQICEALEIKPYFVPLELQKSFTDQIFESNLN